MMGVLSLHEASFHKKLMPEGEEKPKAARAVYSTITVYGGFPWLKLTMKWSLAMRKFPQ